MPKLYILSFWNTDKVTDALHTVAVRKTEIGKYVLYNYRGNKNGQENTDGIKLFVEEEGVQPIVLFTINIHACIMHSIGDGMGQIRCT